MNEKSQHYSLSPAKAGFGTFPPPHDVLADVFTAGVRRRWSEKLSDHLNRRLNILGACGSCPSDGRRAAILRGWRARKAAWEAYLYTSFACGLFEGNRGIDLRQRLASRGDIEFLAAMAECIACWFFAGKQKLQFLADAPGRNGRNLDMQVIIDGPDVGVEVKAPYREPPTNGFGPATTRTKSRRH